MFNYKEINTIETNYLNHIQNSHVLGIYTVENGFLIEYKLDNVTFQLSIQIKKINDIKSYICLNDEENSKKEKTLYFNDIKTIYRIFYLEKDDETERVEILYKNKDDVLNAYSLTIDEKINSIFKIEKYENIFQFKSQILGDKDKTKLDFSYDDKYYYPMDYPICLGRKIDFEFDEQKGIKAFNLSSYSKYLTIASNEVLEALGTEEKDRLIHFLLLSQLYVNSLYINSDLNEIIFDEEEKIQLLEKKLIEQNWKKELIYCNGEQGHPSTNEIYLFKKEDKKLIWFWSIVDYGDDSRVKLKFSAICNNELNDYFKQIGLQEFKKVEVWYEDNYEIQKHEAVPYLSATFNYTSEAIKYIEDRLTDELIHIIKHNKEISVNELIEGYRFGGNDYFLKNSKEGFSSWRFVEENAQLILDCYKKSEIEVHQKVEKLRENRDKKINSKSNSFYRILVSGSTGVLLQRAFDFEPVSLDGFIFFLVVFSTISYIWVLLFPSYDNLSESEIKTKKKSRKEYFLIFKEYFYKLFLLIFGLLILNVSVNFISYKYGFFDDNFKYRFDTKKAISLNIKQEPIKSFTLWDKSYFLYKEDKNYYLVEQNSIEPKKEILTLYSKVYLGDIYSNLKDEKDFLDILNNISPTVYKEVSILDFLFKPLWLSNTIKDKYWLSDDIKYYEDRYKSKLLEEKEKNYKALISKEYKNLSEVELFELLKEIYVYYAFTYDSKQIMDMFIELENRPREKLEGLKVSPYQFAFMSYLKFLEAKHELNKTLEKYEKGVVFTFDFWDYKPDDYDSNGNSNIRFVDLKTQEKSIFWYNNYKNISIEDNKLYLNQKDEKTIFLGEFDKEDLDSIKTKLNFMINLAKTIDFLYEKLKSS